MPGRRISDEELLAMLREAVRITGGYVEYRAWQAMRREHGWPDAGTINKRFGGWVAALEAAGVHAPATVEAVEREEARSILKAVRVLLVGRITEQDYEHLRVRSRRELPEWDELISRIG